MSRATRITERCTYHGEGTFWDAEHGRLLLVDMLAGAVVEVAADGSTSRHEYGGVAAMIRRRTSGGFVLAVEHGFRMLDDDLEPTGEEIHVFDDPGVRMNEGGCDPAGRVYCGTMAYDQAKGAGTMWRVDAGHAVTEAFAGVTVSNGLQWSADGRYAYYNDTPTRTVARIEYDVASGAFGHRSDFAVLPDHAGFPDGMGIDVEGGIWVAAWGGSAVRRYDRDGMLTAIVELPVRQVTSCTFGGQDLSTLFISTSRENLPDDGEPLAGSVFAYDAGIRGAHLHPYAG